MDLVQLKADIENKDINIDFLIFKYTDIFLPYQYITEIKKLITCEINYIDCIEDILYSNNLFKDNTKCLDIFYTDKFDCCSTQILNKNNLIVVCKDLSKNVAELFKDRIIEFPKIDTWQIKDFAYSVAEGVDKEKLDTLIDICNKDIFRLDNELSKIRIFDKEQRKNIFNMFINNGVFDDLSSYNVFDLSNSILQKNINKLISVYSDIDNIDCEPLGLVTILYNNIKNIINIQLSNIGPEDIGLEPKRYWAIKKNMCGFYTKEQLIKGLKIITDIDRQLKSGEIDTRYIVDYLIVHLLSL